MKSEFYKRNADTRDELLACILGDAARIMKSAFNSDEPHTILIHELLSYWVIDYDGEIFEHLLWNIANLLFQH